MYKNKYPIMIISIPEILKELDRLYYKEKVNNFPKYIKTGRPLEFSSYENWITPLYKEYTTRKDRYDIIRLTLEFAFEKNLCIEDSWEENTYMLYIIPKKFCNYCNTGDKNVQSNPE
jgi:hypothetical protein